MTGTGSAPGCIFCDEAAHPQRDDLILLRGSTSYVILNLYPYNNGHLMVVPYRHLGSLAAATEPELAELMRLTRDAEVALTEAYQPQGINVGINLAGRRAPAWSITSIFTWCRAGPATPTSCRSSATCVCSPKSWARRRSACGPSSSASRRERDRMRPRRHEQTKANMIGFVPSRRRGGCDVSS